MKYSELIIYNEDGDYKASLPLSEFLPVEINYAYKDSAELTKLLDATKTFEIPMSPEALDAFGIVTFNDVHNTQRSFKCHITVSGKVIFTGRVKLISSTINTPNPVFELVAFTYANGLLEEMNNMSLDELYPFEINNSFPTHNFSNVPDSPHPLFDSSRDFFMASADWLGEQGTYGRQLLFTEKVGNQGVHLTMNVKKVYTKLFQELGIPVNLKFFDKPVFEDTCVMWPFRLKNHKTDTGDDSQNMRQREVKLTWVKKSGYDYMQPDQSLYDYHNQIRDHNGEKALIFTHGGKYDFKVSSDSPNRFVTVKLDVLAPAGTTLEDINNISIIINPNTNVTTNMFDSTNSNNIRRGEWSMGRNDDIGYDNFTEVVYVGDSNGKPRFHLTVEDIWVDVKDTNIIECIDINKGANIFIQEEYENSIYAAEVNDHYGVGQPEYLISTRQVLINDNGMTTSFYPSVTDFELDDRELAHVLRNVKDMEYSEKNILGDLFSTIMSVFNLYMYYDFKNSEFVVETQKDIYTDTVIDWTDKLDRTDEFSTEHIKTNISKLTLTYDTVADSAKRDDKCKEMLPYGTVEYSYGETGDDREIKASYGSFNDPLKRGVAVVDGPKREYKLYDIFRRDMIEIRDMDFLIGFVNPNDSETMTFSTVGVDVDENSFINDDTIDTPASEVHEKTWPSKALSEYYLPWRTVFNMPMLRVAQGDFAYNFEPQEGYDRNLIDLHSETLGEIESSDILTLPLSLSEADVSVLDITAVYIVEHRRLRLYSLSFSPNGVSQCKFIKA